MGHEWYATVREGRDIGPYSNRIEAELAVARLVVRRMIASPARATAIDDRPGEPGTTRFEVVVEELVAWHYARQLRTETSAYVWTKQRLEGLRKDPSSHDHWPVRVHVLEQLLSELDR